MAGKDRERKELYKIYYDLFKKIKKDLKRSNTEVYSSPYCTEDPDDPVTLRINKWGKEPERPYAFDCYHYMLGNEQVQRRIEASINTEQIAFEKIGLKMKQEVFRDLWIFMSTLYLKGGYDSVDEMGDCIIAAAIWILDEINLDDKMDELYPYIADAYEDPDEDVTLYNHPCYDNNLILAVKNTIVHRNDGLYAPDQFKHYWTDPWTVSSSRKNSAGSKRRQNFEGMMSLLNEDRVKEAKLNYEGKVWEFYRITCRIDDILQSKIEQYDKEIYSVENKIISLNNDLLMSRNGSKQAGIQQSILSPLMNPARRNDFSSYEHEKDRLKREKDRLHREKRELEAKALADFSSMGYVDEREKHAKDWKGIVPRELLDNLVNFSVQDPFESSFALLALLDDNSDIPWLCYGSVSVFYTLQDQLPRPQKYFLRKFSYIFKKSRNETSEAYQMLYKSSHRFDEVGDCEGDLVTREKAENLAQKLFARTYMLLPRIKTEIADIESLMEEIGVETEKEREAYELLLQVLWTAAWANESGNEGIERFKKSLAEANAQNEIKEQELDKSGTEIDPQMVSDLKHKIDTLNRYYRDEAAKVRTLQRERDQLKTEADEMLRELSELRNIVFNRENPELIEEDNETGIAFPYITKGRVISFGGHTSWLKSMREYLPDVRFISPDMLPNTTLIRMADAVWIQPNCLSHADYYRIINAIRDYKIQIHYYENSSALKCAVQLAQEDQKKNN